MNHTFFRPARLALAIAAALPVAAFAAPGADSPYRKDAQHSHVEDATSRGISQVNMITCFMSAMRPDALVNAGNYVALVDETKCDPEARSSTGNSSSTSSGANAASYMTAIVNSTRESNDDPMRVRTWLEEEEEGFNATIYVNTSASEAPSDANPYGVFRLDFCGRGDVGGCMMNGFLEGGADGITYFEIEGGMGGDEGSTKALRLTTSGEDSGSGALEMDGSMGGMDFDIAYSFAYNADYFRRSDGTQDECFSRDASDEDAGMSVWRYGLYDGETGERVNRSSGFPIEFTADDKTYHGHMGYWGLWLPPEASSQLVSGSTVQRVEYQPDAPPVKTDYTLLKAEGRLMKYTKQTRTLAESDKIKFQTHVWNLDGFFEGAQPDRQYEMYWDDAAGAFKVAGVVECGEGGCQTQTFDVEKTVAASYFASMGGMRGWSQSLGGEVFIPLHGVGDTVDSDAIDVIFRVQDLVYPADMPATLYCLRECPTAASIASYFAPGSNAMSPFVASTFNQWEPVGAGSAVAYTMDFSAAVLRDGANAAVVFTDGEALQSRPQFQWGVRTGRLFTDLADAQCPEDPTKLCDHKVDQIDVYYQWETGPNQWNQFAAVKDAAGDIVAFDAPLNVNYEVPEGARYGQYAGKSIVLQYGGFGELWGIPGHCVSSVTNEKVSCEGPETRYVPAFVIPFDEVLGRVANGSTQMLAKWLDREIRFARKDVSVCAAAGLTLPSGLTLPTSDSLQDPSDPESDIYIGAKPEVAEAARVIHGDVKY